ncbi:hypothetical protein BBO99_00003292 [Phytophthora kernoviae]|uniref:Protein kinase domain-containing protein n=2 Tax=Phytophthora kernoviae TaxID=325452 RepID=A0A3R7G0U3_9STRA|nr:hypothetical protein G195_009092 [Phytophthora kernoviae 00238/432]KAG2518490.1 hypothetical protein JM16_007345 [Phytophthora kernoviae]KAG2519862.1 hypothetical protein JM18_007415 [Phytophthora kernoviae]RLN13985.1 hypothetical protein BBI17_007732 [Phytophthora kernoviae]RLN81934.1 hypothetical protein BBO99_00003292 [Phytophthora kernoviae]
MGNVSLCAATDGITPVHGAMWSDGGTDDVIPVSEMQRHAWDDNGTSYTIMAIHLSGDPNSYGKCVMPSMTIPCIAYNEYSSGDCFVRQITIGAYGEVWVGRMRGEIVAVKRLIHDRRHEMRELEDFATEIQLMASFSHANVLGLLGVAWTKLENMCLIMQYMERGDLQQVLQHNNRKTQYNQSNNSIDEFSWASHKAKIARDISCGLEYLHGLNPTVVHRDLKSKNVLIGDNFEVKLGDFGVSRMRHDEETMTSGVGTAYWTAPEVLAGQKYSEKADVYSLGVVLAELDTGELPFYDARTSDGDKMEVIHILHLVVSGKLQPSFSLDCPEDVRKLALACLNPMPDNRPTAKDVMNELIRLLESDDVVSNEMIASQIGGFM